MWACDSSACNAHPPAPVAPATAASWSSQHTQHVAISGPSTPSCPRSHMAPSFPSMRSGATCSFLSKAALEPNLDSLRGTHPPTDTHALFLPTALLPMSTTQLTVLFALVFLGSKEHKFSEGNMSEVFAHCRLSAQNSARHITGDPYTHRRNRGLFSECSGWFAPSWV